MKHYKIISSLSFISILFAFISFGQKRSLGVSLDDIDHCIFPCIPVMKRAATMLTKTNSDRISKIEFNKLQSLFFLHLLLPLREIDGERKYLID